MAATRKRILVLSPFPRGGIPSQRFRFEQYIGAWEAAGYEVVQESFWDRETAPVVHRKGHTVRKVRGFALGLLRRLRSVLASGRFDAVFVHLGAVPAGPPIIEALCMLRGWRVIYDIDDAIFLGTSSNANPLLRLLRSSKHVEFVARHADQVVVVNPFLSAWARRLNPHVSLIPTTIDPTYHRPPPTREAHAVPVLGWTGTFTTTIYLDVVREALAQLQRERPFRLRVICDVDPGFPELDDYEFVKWRADTEIEDLWPIDVGLMPLTGATVAKGKVGFKAIQYSALEIPSVVSDEGSGREVVEDGVTGLVVANTTEAWVSALKRLIDEPALRRRLGAAARAKIMGTYSVPAQTPAYLALIEG